MRENGVYSIIPPQNLDFALRQIFAVRAMNLSEPYPFLIVGKNAVSSPISGR